MKEIDQRELGRKICKINHQEAAIKAARAVMLWVLHSALLTLQPHKLPDVQCVPRLLDQQHWNQARDRGTRWAAETDAIFLP